MMRKRQKKPKVATMRMEPEIVFTLRCYSVGKKSGRYDNVSTAGKWKGKIYYLSKIKNVTIDAVMFIVKLLKKAEGFNNQELDWIMSFKNNLIKNLFARFQTVVQTFLRKKYFLEVDRYFEFLKTTNIKLENFVGNILPKQCDIRKIFGHFKSAKKLM